MGKRQSTIERERKALEVALRLFSHEMEGARLRQEFDQVRTRWSKEEIVASCRWPWPCTNHDKWKLLRDMLEVKLDLLRPDSQTACFTFVVLKQDRLDAIWESLKSEAGGMSRTSHVLQRQVHPIGGYLALETGDLPDVADRIETMAAWTVNRLRFLARGGADTHEEAPVVRALESGLE